MRFGQDYSTSRNACVLSFVGGPADGKSGLYDHGHYDCIAFWIGGERKTYQYKPAGNRVYELDEVIEWHAPGPQREE